MNSVKVGICGLGTVASGTVDVLRKNAEDISARCGFPIEIAQIGARRDNPNVDTSTINVTRDIFDVVINPEVDIVVELIGGYEPAKALVLKAIENGKHVVTANKALIAVHGNEIFAAASRQGVTVAYEAAVAGGIPIIKAIREGLSGNRIDWLAGIINGTGNFILTEMRDKGRAFDDVLKEAQALGYAEADPTFDIEGIDAAHKLVILASIAFGIPLQFDSVFAEGISKVSPIDVAYAEELGYVIKHLGIARRTEQGVELRVHPTLIPARRLMAHVNGVMNAVMVHGNAVGPTLYNGAGAGALPTASAVVADIVDVARSLATSSKQPIAPLGFQPETLSGEMILPIEEVETAYYLRLSVVDKPGVLSKVAQILSDAGISIEALIQKEHAEDSDLVPLIILTNKTLEKNCMSAITSIESLDTICGSVVPIRVESLE